MMNPSAVLQVRRNMVDNQLRPNKVNTGPLLQRFMDVPREIFADSSHQEQAYVDNLLPMTTDRTMYAPMTLARMLQELNLTEQDKVLIVAGGTGYSAAIIAPLVAEVVVVEEDGYLLDVAKSAAIDLHLDNISFVRRAPEKGCLAKAPYNCILFDSAVEEIPQVIINQLAENGRICAVIDDNSVVKEATVFVKVGKTLFEEKLFETKGDVLKNFQRTEKFVF